MLIALALAYTTCIALSLAMNRHFQQVWPTRTRSPRTAILLRNAGWLLLLITLVYCAKLEGVAVGLVLMLGLYALSALALCTACCAAICRCNSTSGLAIE
jgi:hypothetical protein